MNCARDQGDGGAQWPSDRFPVIIPNFPVIDENVVFKLAADVSKARVAEVERRRREVREAKRKQRQGGGSGEGKGQWKQAMEEEERVAWYVQIRAVYLLLGLSWELFVPRQRRFYSWMAPETPLLEKNY
jgi:hypothetical protein